MTGAQIQERYGTEAEQFGDDKKIASIWRRTPTAFEGEKIIELPYTHYITLAAAVGVTAPQQYKINSIYDPDLSGAGNQPLGRDLWAGVYNYYKVLETYVTMEVLELTDDSTGGVGNNQKPSIIGLMCDLTANPPTDLGAWINASMVSKTNEQQYFNMPITSDIINGRGSKTHLMTYKWDASQFDTSIIDNTKNEWTAVGSDPANLNFMSFLYYNPNSLSATRTVILRTQVRYLVAFKQVNRTLMNTIN